MDLGRVNQYLQWPVRAGMWWHAVREDVSILDQLRRGLVPLPVVDGSRPDGRGVFPAPRTGHEPVWAGKRVVVVASGGSGALASVVGVVRALDEAGVRPAAFGLCSGSVLFGLPLAAGLPTQDVADALLRLRPTDYLDPDWRRLALAPARLGRGWAALMRGEAVEATFADLLGDVTLGELPVPVWFPVWNIEDNRLRYLSSVDDPDLPAARAVRMAIALPLAFDPVPYQGRSYLDGGIVEILPAQPFVHPGAYDAAVVVNGFYRPGFLADEEHEWQDAPFTVLRMAGQTRLMHHVDVAQRSLASLQAATEVHLLDPVPYSLVHGAGLYTQFVDRRRWADFMRAGYESAWGMLDGLAEPPPRRRRREDGRESPSTAARSLAARPRSSRAGASARPA
jgi:NTE family protein